MTFSRANRLIHHWATLIVAVPVILIIGSGILLLLKKDIDWIQPPSAQGDSQTPIVSFDQILATARTVPDAQISKWADIDRLDVRPSKGIVKVRSHNGWEIQIDTQTAKILQVAYRRSDLIESIHDGSFFHEKAKLWLFLPAAIVLGVMWFTGLYLFALPHLAKAKKAKRKMRRRPQIPTG